MKIPYRLIGLLFLFLPPVSSGWVAAQVLDPNFYPTFSTRAGVVHSIAKQPDQKILVAGEFYEPNGVSLLSIMRLTPDGMIDPSFASTKVTDSGSGPGIIHDIELQADGKIIIVGNFRTVSGQPRYGIARLNGDGTLDTSFQDGMTGLWASTGYSVGIQSDGKIVVGGSFAQVNGVNRSNLLRLTSNGSVDLSFFDSQVSGVVYSVGIQPDDKILIGGGFASVQLTARNRIARLAADGSLDTSFLPTGAGANDEVADMHLQPDGKILVAGAFTSLNGATRNRIARLLTNGDLDTTFGNGLAGSNGRVEFIARQPDGKVLVGGAFTSIDGIANNKLARLNDDGALDASFLSPLGSESERIYSAVTMQAGKIVAGGSFQNVGGALRQHVARFNQDGSLDLSFPHIYLDQQGGVSEIVRQPDGKIIAAGYFSFANGFDAQSIVRLNRDGTRDLGFSFQMLPDGGVRKMRVLNDGKILVAGTFVTPGPNSRRNIARLHPDGSVDPGFATEMNSGEIQSFDMQGDGKIVIVGLFNSIGAQPRNNIARLNADGSLDTTFLNGMPGTNNWVLTVAAEQNGKIMIGGSFATINNVSQNNLARLNADGSLDQTFVANTKGMVEDIDIQADGKYVISGYFFDVNGVSRGQIARLNTNGSLDTTFLNGLQGTDGEVLEVVLQNDGRILVSGVFNTVNGVPRTVARLLTDGNLDLSFREIAIHHPSFRDTESLLLEPDGNLLIGGYFGRVDGTPRSGLFRVSLRTTPFDFDGDGKTDIGIFRPTVGEWWINRSSNGSTFAAQFGATTDKLAPGDFTGDGKADIAVWRPSSGEWFILRSEDSSFFSFPFGTIGDTPMPADYDNDGKVDAAVFRESSATWYIRRSSDNGTTIEGFGASGDVPVVADYDGDGKSDIAIYRPSLGQWWIKRSTQGVIAFTFGNSTDKPVQGNYTGDGKADVAFWRPSSGEWYILRSEDFSYYSQPFGAASDIPSPGDYDGDGKFDPTVFRSSSATWFSQRSTAGTLIQQFGATGDRPVPNAFVP